jgi:quinol monooxygenase YgiN
MKQRVRRELAALLEPTRAEKGCINYDMHQALTDPALFLFHENWTSAADLDAHLASPHIQRWIRLADELLAEPIEITRWTPVG